MVASSLRAGDQEPAAMRLSPPGLTMRKELSSVYIGKTDIGKTRVVETHPHYGPQNKYL